MKKITIDNATIYIDNATIYCGDALAVLKTLPDCSVQMVCTSPPYFGLRDYGTGKWVGGDPKCDHKKARNKTRFERGGLTEKQGSNRGSDGDEGTWKKECPSCGAIREDKQIGIENTPAVYVKNLVRIFREVRRVLRDDGVCFINIGDSYAQSGKGGNPAESKHQKQKTNRGSLIKGRKAPAGFKAKDRLGIPHRLVFALQEDGWYWRDEIVWYAPNKMPESVTDRCGKAHEFIFMLTKSPRYYYDHIAIRESAAKPAQKYQGDPSRTKKKAIGPHARGCAGFNHQYEIGRVWAPEGRRNKRSVWTIPVGSDKIAHFATYPPKLIIPCIRAGTSKKGCCSECGAPWRRIIKKKRSATRPGMVTKIKKCGKNSRFFVNRDPNHSEKRRVRSDYLDPAIVGNRDPQRHITSAKTIGWEQSCYCITRYYTRDNDYDEVTPEPKPCVVLDPFAGSGTTGVVALENNCSPILIELNPEYIPFIKRKVKKALSRKGFGL